MAWDFKERTRSHRYFLINLRFQNRETGEAVRQFQYFLPECRPGERKRLDCPGQYLKLHKTDLPAGVRSSIFSGHAGLWQREVPEVTGEPVIILLGS